MQVDGRFMPEIIEVLENIYNIDKGDMDDYQWLSQKNISDYCYCGANTKLIYDPEYECYTDDDDEGLMIPADFILKNIEHKVIEA